MEIAQEVTKAETLTVLSVWTLNHSPEVTNHATNPVHFHPKTDANTPSLLIISRNVAVVLTARTKQEGRRNHKKCLLALRESDWLIVASSQAQAPKLVKGPTDQRSPHRQPGP